MGNVPVEIVCHVKAYRQAKGWSQSQLAELVGVKRQAIYDVESGRYLPNTAVALQMAKVLGTSVEKLFSEEITGESLPIKIMSKSGPDNPRLLVARLRGQLIGVPLSGKIVLNSGLPAADALLENQKNTARLFCPGELPDHTIFLFGCDPALSILGAHVARKTPPARIHCCFASSYASLQALSGGMAHVAGVHLHNTEEAESNVLFARRIMGDISGKIIGFTNMDEGLMVASKNPKHIQAIADLARKDVNMVNREPGAALRMFLDDRLKNAGISVSDVNGYDRLVFTHNEGAQMVAAGLADAALGLHVVADLFNLDFVPLINVRCDLVIPEDIMAHSTVQVMLDVLQSRALREEIAAIPGYETSASGDVIDEL